MDQDCVGKTKEGWVTADTEDALEMVRGLGEGRKVKGYGFIRGIASTCRVRQRQSKQMQAGHRFVKLDQIPSVGINI